MENPALAINHTLKISYQHIAIHINYLKKNLFVDINLHFAPSTVRALSPAPVAGNRQSGELS